MYGMVFLSIPASAILVKQYAARSDDEPASVLLERTIHFATVKKSRQKPLTII